MYVSVVAAVVALASLDANRPVAADDSGVSFPKRDLDSLAERFTGKLGFFAQDLKSGATYSWQADKRFPPASVIKLPVMMELYRQAAAGRIDLDEKRRLPDDISTHGTGVLKRREAPVELSLREYCRLMVV